MFLCDVCRQQLANFQVIECIRYSQRAHCDHWNRSDTKQRNGNCSVACSSSSAPSLLAHPEPARRAPLRNRRGLGEVSCRTGRRLRRGAGAASSQHLVAIVISNLILLVVNPIPHRSVYPPCHPQLQLELYRGLSSMLCRYLAKYQRGRRQCRHSMLLEKNTNKQHCVVWILLTVFSPPSPLPFQAKWHTRRSKWLCASHWSWFEPCSKSTARPTR